MEGALPNMVIIGVQKCGTTALHSYLARHPEISMSKPKELDFFISGEGGRWEQGLDWYRERFDPSTPVRGESSPNYTADPKFPGVAERMARTIPDAKLIFMVRDPIDRVRSNYVHTYSNRVESRPIEQAVLDPASEYLARSRYHHQLSIYLEHFPSEQILVLEQDELSHNNRETLPRVFRFLGVRDDVWRDAFEKRRLESSSRRRRTALGNQVAKRVSMKRWRGIRDRRPFSKPFERPEISDELRARIADALRDDITRFRELTGRSFENWSV
ncbi:sulfotransferase [Thermoleophilia bacterium SCSIO 60948]|nr:sulfotransferase [Thermoleophilia bacterium SCSIO 60948]